MGSRFNSRSGRITFTLHGWCLNTLSGTFYLTMSATQTSHARIGSLWQQRMDTLREYEVVRDGNVFATSFSNTIVFSSEYEIARQNLTDLLTRYDGYSIDRVFSGGREQLNEGGHLLPSGELRILPQPCLRSGPVSGSGSWRPDTCPWDW